MVRLMVGKKGSGKTKKMIEAANDYIRDSKGSTIFINNDRRLTCDLNYRIRVVCVEDYQQLGTVDEYIGFIMGIISSDHDIEMIFVDSVTKHANISLENISVFIDRLDLISEKYHIDFVVSISAEADEIIDIVVKHEVLNNV